MDLPMHGAFILHRVFEMSGMSHSRSPARKLVELVGADDARKTSPYCWRIRFALAQKQLQYESVPWRRVEKEAIGFTGQGKVRHCCSGEATSRLFIWPEVLVDPCMASLTCCAMKLGSRTYRRQASHA